LSGPTWKRFWRWSSEPQPGDQVFLLGGDFGMKGESRPRPLRRTPFHLCLALVSQRASNSDKLRGHVPVSWLLRTMTSGVRAPVCCCRPLCMSGAMQCHSTSPATIFSATAPRELWRELQVPTWVGLHATVMQWRVETNDCHPRRPLQARRSLRTAPKQTHSALDIHS
jgi:hypothetical protein